MIYMPILTQLLPVTVMPIQIFPVAKLVRQMFTPLLKSCPQQTHPSFPRHSALLLSGPRPFIPTPDRSASCSGPCSDLMAFCTILLSLVTSHSPLHPTSLFIPSVLITYPPCFKRMFDTYTYALCRYLPFSLFLHIPVLPLHVLLVSTCLTCLHILRPCTQVSFILFVLHSLLTARPKIIVAFSYQSLYQFHSHSGPSLHSLLESSYHLETLHLRHTDLPTCYPIYESPRSKGSPPDSLHTYHSLLDSICQAINIGLFAHLPGSHAKKCAMSNNVVNNPMVRAELLASIAPAFAGRHFPDSLQHSSAVQCIGTIVRSSHHHPLSGRTRIYDIGHANLCPS